MSRLEVLCATMHQTDFSKIEEMNIKSDVVFANQSDHEGYDEITFDGYRARMVTTSLRGVGKNRNIALLYADSEIGLLADDDVRYADNYVETVCGAFNEIPDADVIIFNIYSTSEHIDRKPTQIKKRGRLNKLSRNPFGGPRISFRISSVKKANLWFTLLFGGGCLFSSGEDSLWLRNALHKGLKIYKYPKTIGSVSMEESSWFNGFDEKLYYGKGAYYKASSPVLFLLWILYFAFRTRKNSDLDFGKRLLWMRNGAEGYKSLISYDEWKNSVGESKSL
ncbi:MAG: glycosyltransferase [Oscillospiraceae bacterium]|nr:glycosyltransferase [Oscillospiraceae bacterium]MDD4413157.1 glycosyltransferase [Oscillospiraceae bacterium]